MPSPTPELEELNARRRRAVQLRVDGRSLAQIRAETGLSVPPIIKAYQAIERGSWAAIDVGERGRPRGTGRALEAAQETVLRQAALTRLPEQYGLKTPLWDGAALQQLVQERFGV